MNQNQINQVKQPLEEFSSIDLSSLIAKKYGERADLLSVEIGEYNAKEYLSSVNKVFGQFIEEIDGVYSKALPYQYNFHNEHGSGNLHQDLVNLLAQIKSLNFPASIPQLSKLIHYQAINGFWEKSKRKYFRSSEVNIKDDQERMDLTSKHMLEVSKKLSGLVDEISEEKEVLNRFITSKKSELSEIESLLAPARLHSNEISGILNKVSALEERISSTLEQSEEKKSSIDETNVHAMELIDEIKSLLKNNSEDTKLQSENYTKLISLFEEKLEFVESKKEYFEERNKALDDLIGREVGASLFETFKQRKTELMRSSKFWACAVPVTAMATIAWIFFLFGTGDLSGLAWQVILINSLKALPAVGLLLFSISQYVKERNFQEEYAFKSAVALTVNSYAEQLEEAENKDKMIMESVGQIYASPIHQKFNPKDAYTLSLASKELIEKAKSITPSK